MKSLTFHVKHGKWSADLQIPASDTLSTLAEAIIDAVGFYMDHCYGYYDNLKKHWQSNEEYTLFADVGQEAKANDTGVERTRIESVFQPKKKMLFLFDYGDDWMFTVTCTGELESPPFKGSKLLATKGEPPEQYPDLEDD